MSDWFVRLFIRDMTPTWFFYATAAAAFGGSVYVVLHFLLKYW